MLRYIPNQAESQEVGAMPLSVATVQYLESLFPKDFSVTPAIMPARMTDLDALFSRAAREIAAELMPDHWFVNENAPTTLESLTRQYQAQGGMLTVNPWYGPESVFADKATQWAWQAWHDFAHVMTQGEFDMAGECRVHVFQIANLQDWAKRNHIPAESLARASAIMRAHNIGRLKYWESAGHAPSNFREFAAGYLLAMGL